MQRGGVVIYLRVEEVARRINYCKTVAIHIYPFPSEGRLESLESILPDTEILRYYFQSLVILRSRSHSYQETSRHPPSHHHIWYAATDPCMHLPEGYLLRYPGPTENKLS